MRVKRWLALALVLALVMSAAAPMAFAAELEEPDGGMVGTQQALQEEPAGAEPREQEWDWEESAEAGTQEEPEDVSEPEELLPDPEEPEESEAEEPGEGASEGEAETGTESDALCPEGSVTGFVGSGPVQKLNITDANRPALEELTQQMPERLPMLVEGTQQSIPVSWYCVGEDYGQEQSYYYQFSPRWDTERWPLAQGLSVVEEAPYVAVFVSGEELGAQSAQSVELECYTFFTTKMGLNSAAACGILANIYNECAFKPNNLQQIYEKKLKYTDETYTAAVDNGTYKNFVHDSAGYGLVQFTWWELKRDLLAYARKKGKSIGDTQTQLEYLQISLGAKRTSDMKKIPNTANGAYQAGKYFCDEYEKPGLKEQPVARARLARDTFWPKYKNAYARAKTGLPNALEAPELASLTPTAAGLRFVWNGREGATKYRVFRKGETGSWVRLGDTAQLSWTDETAASGKTWSYTVYCLNASGKRVSSYDPVGLSRTFWRAPVIKSLCNTAKGVRLSWNSRGCPGYLVSRKRKGQSAWEQPELVTKCSWVDTGAVSGQTYVYAVSCADLEGRALSKRQSKTILCLEAPVLKGVSNVSRGIRVRWKGSAGVSGYWVCRRQVNGKWKRIAVLKGKGRGEYIDRSTARKNGAVYEYTVRAYSGSTLSGYTNPGDAICRLNAPKLKSVSYRKGKLTAKWSRGARAQGYELRLVRGAEVKRVLLNGGGRVRYTLPKDKELKKGKWKVIVRSWRTAGGKIRFSAWSGSKKCKIT